MQWLNNGLNFLSGIRLYLLIGAVWAASLGGAYILGQRNQAEDSLETITRTITETVYVPVKEIQEVQVRNLETERRLQRELAQQRSENQELRNILNETPDTNPGVYLSVGDVCLLDAATASHPGATAPCPADISSYQERAPSDVELRSFIDTELLVRGQYNDLARRHDELVDWVERELINEP